MSKSSKKIDVDERKIVAVCSYPEYFLYRKKEKKEEKKEEIRVEKLPEITKKKKPIVAKVEREIVVKMNCVLIPITGEPQRCIEDECYFWDKNEKKCVYRR